MPTVWVVSGNKGGVGKSLVALGLTQTLINECGKDEVSVIDGDARTPDVQRLCVRRMPTRVLDFRMLRPDSPHSMSEDDYWDVISGYLRVSDHVVINTPDGADDQLMGWFDSTLRCTEEMSTQSDVNFKFVFVLSPVEDGLQYLPKLAGRFQKLYPVRNLYFGGTERFRAFNEQYAGLFGSVLDFPVLHGGEVDRVKWHRVMPQEYADMRWSRANPDVVVPRVLSRQRVQDWLCKVTDTFYDSIYSNESNLMQGII